MAIYKIEYTTESVLEWAYWIEGEDHPDSDGESCYWLVGMSKTAERITTVSFNHPLSQYRNLHSGTIVAITTLTGLTLGSLFQQLHDITEEEGPA